MPLTPIDTPHDPRLADYLNLKDAQLRALSEGRGAAFVAAGCDLARALRPVGTFPKADTTFPKTRRAQRSVEGRRALARFLALIDRLCLTIFSTLKLSRREAR